MRPSRRPDPVEATSAKDAFARDRPLPESALAALDWINRKDEYLDQLLRAGNHLALEVEKRWSGPNGCDCNVCTAAKAWRELVREGLEGSCR